MIKIELYRLIKNKKNLLILLAMCLFSFFLVFQLNEKAVEYDGLRKQEYQGARPIIKGELEVLKFEEETSEVIEAREYWRTEQKYVGILGSRYDPRSNGREILSNKERIVQERDRYQMLLDGKAKQYDDSYLLMASSEMELKKEILSKEYLLEHSIKQYDTPYEMNLMNYLVHLFDSPNIFVFLVLISLICIDSLTGDFDCNSYKTLYTIPISRERIVCSKMIAGIIVSFLSMGVSLLLPSIFVMMSSSIGTAGYPIVLDTLEIIVSIEYIMKGMIILFCLILFMVAFITLLAVILRSGTAIIMAVGSIFIILYCMSEMSFTLPVYLSYIPILSIDIASAMNLKEFSVELYALITIAFMIVCILIARRIIKHADLVGGDD